MLFETATDVPLTIALIVILLIVAILSFFTFDVFGQRKLSKDFGCFMIAWVMIGGLLSFALGRPSNTHLEDDVIMTLSKLDLNALMVESQDSSDEVDAVRHVIGYRPTSEPALYLDCVFHEGNFNRLDMRQSYFPSNMQGDLVFELGRDLVSRTACMELNDRARDT